MASSSRVGDENQVLQSMKMRLAERVMAWRGEVLLGMLLLGKDLCWSPGLRNLYRAVLIHLVRKTGLFDREHYAETNGDVAVSGMSPLRHYVAYGDREGRSPMPLFDPVFYREHVSGVTRRVNALLHYAYVGRYRHIAPSPWFDVAFYLAHNKDVARSRVDPLTHYLQWGGLEGRSPCVNFDGSFYLRSNPDVAEARVNPLLHYLRFGRIEGRATHSPHVGAEAQNVGAPIPVPVLPSAEERKRLPVAGSQMPRVDVVVPVYKGRAETMRCLLSVLAARNATPYELVVINDAGPDPELTADLEGLARRGLITLHANMVNRGFVYTVNRGMALHTDRDVVLLNSDTEVYGDWLDRLRAASQRNERTGTVTPLSNNATICSYPRFLYDNPYPLEVSYEALDSMAAAENAGMEVEVPTAVGFCMYIRRDCLADVGFFDEAAFGKGYGEENDFCQRAIQKDWRNIVAADVFVRHWGSTSFQGERSGRVQAALKVLSKRYPDYQQAVRNFIEQDPLSAARRKLDWARLKAQVKAENVLVVCHSRGGGAERHVQEDTRSLLASGAGVFYLRPPAGQPAQANISHPVCRNLPNLAPTNLADTAQLGAVLQQLRLTRVHTHGLVDFLSDAPLRIQALAEALHVPLWVDIHDYKVICPRINLIDREGKYCGEPLEESRCNACLQSAGNEFGARSIGDWRAMHHRVLKSAEKVFAPDQDVVDRLSRYFPDISYAVTPHEDIDPRAITIRSPELAADERMRIVVIGAIGKMKGFDVLLACARAAKKNRLAVDFIVLGYSMNDALLEQAGIVVTGRYLEHEALDRLQALAPHVVWLPSTWPETYSYTLSLALKVGYPVFAFDLGAIAHRLRSLGLGDGLMPFSLADKPDRINGIFEAYRKEHMKFADQKA